METKNQNIIKRWWKLAEPDTKTFFFQILFFVGYTVFLTVLTIFAARTINCMYEENWSGAFLNLGLELLTIVLRNVFMHIDYIYYGKQIKIIRHNIAKKIYNKIISCKNTAFNDVSKEKIINVALNNMVNISDFADNIANFVAYGISVIFSLVTVFVSSYIAGIVVCCLAVVNFIAYYLFNKKIGKIMLSRFEKKDDMFKSYSKIIDGKNIIKELNGNEKYESELMTEVDKFSDEYAKYHLTVSWKDNIWYAIWNIAVYGIAALMMFIVSKGEMPITTYLIIVPFLSSCTDKLNSLFDKTNNIEHMRVDVDRINLILNMNDDEFVKYGEVNHISSGYNLALIDVTTKNLKKANLVFETNAINVIKSSKNGGKRDVFDLLRRYIKPDGGKVILDNLNLYDYNEKTFKNHINYCASHPTFINASIKENLMLVNNDFEKVKEICNGLKISGEIEKLPHGFETQINTITSSGLLFMLGLARALLTNCKILMVYEIPQDVAENFRKQIVNFLTQFKVDKTIILFTHSTDYDEIASCVYLVKNGAVTQEKFK